MSDLRLAPNVATMHEVGIQPGPLSDETFDAYYDKTSDTVYLNLSTIWPADFVSWDAYFTHYVVPLVVHEHLHGTLYRIGVESRHHWAITKMEEDSATWSH